MTPTRTGEDFDPMRDLSDDPDAIERQEASRRNTSTDFDQAAADRRLPRPTRSRDMDKSGMDPAGEGDSDR